MKTLRLIPIAGCVLFARIASAVTLAPPSISAPYRVRSALP